MLKRGLFLDRDGVINVDYAYVFQKEKFRFIEGIFDLVAKANKLDYEVIVITNQAGIGRGFYTEEDFHCLSEWMCEQFEKNGARIDGIYFCPDHPEYGLGKYKKESFFRKPAPGMILKAAEDFKIDLKNSILVGDKISDCEAGKNAEIEKLFLFNSKENFESAVKINHLSEVISHL